MSGFGIPQDEIGKLIGINPKTLRLHYAEQIELGGIKATARVAQKLFSMACKPNRGGPQAAIFCYVCEPNDQNTRHGPRHLSRWARRPRPRPRPSRL